MLIHNIFSNDSYCYFSSFYHENIYFCNKSLTFPNKCYLKNNKLARQIRELPSPSHKLGVCLLQNIRPGFGPWVGGRHVVNPDAWVNASSCFPVSLRQEAVGRPQQVSGSQSPLPPMLLGLAEGTWPRWQYEVANPLAMASTPQNQLAPVWPFSSHIPQALENFLTAAQWQESSPTSNFQSCFPPEPLPWHLRLGFACLFY